MLLPQIQITSAFLNQDYIFICTHTYTTYTHAKCLHVTVDESWQFFIEQRWTAQPFIQSVTALVHNVTSTSPRTLLSFNPPIQTTPLSILTSPR